MASIAACRLDEPGGGSSLQAAAAAAASRSNTGRAAAAVMELSYLVHCDHIPGGAAGARRRPSHRSPARRRPAAPPALVPKHPAVPYRTIDVTMGLRVRTREMPPQHGRSRPEKACRGCCLLQDLPTEITALDRCARHPPASGRSFVERCSQPGSPPGAHDTCTRSW